jgi:hypothetical protein
MVDNEESMCGRAFRRRRATISLFGPYSYLRGGMQMFYVEMHHP